MLVVLFSVMFSCTGKQLVRRFGGGGYPKGTGTTLVISLYKGLTVLKFFGCASFIVKDVGSVAKTKLSLLRVTLPVKVSFCAFRAVSCAVSICHKRITTRGGVLAFTACMALFPRLVTKPVIRCGAIRGRLVREGIALRSFSRKTFHFSINLTGGILLTGRVKDL